MKIFIFGKNGMLGNTCVRYLSNTWEIIGFHRSDFNPLIHTKEDLSNLLINKVKANDVIINCMGMIPQKNKDATSDYFIVNSYFPHLLESISLTLQCRLIHISTNCVFPSRLQPFTESEFPTPDDIYGYSKLLGEPAKSTVIRTSIIGEELDSHDSLLSWVLSNQGKTVEGFTNYYWNGVTCLEIAKIIEKVISENLYWKGVRHVFSQETVSKHDLVKTISDIYKAEITILPNKKDRINAKLLISDFSPIKRMPSISQQIKEQKNFYEKTS